jgi:hypothetical protein
VTVTDRTLQIPAHLKPADGRFGCGPSKVRPEARWDFNVTRSDVPWHIPVMGPTEIPTFLAALGENVAMEAFEPKQFIVMGDDVVAHIRFAFTVKRTGKRVDQEQLHWWTVQGGKVAGAGKGLPHDPVEVGVLRVRPGDPAIGVPVQARSRVRVSIDADGGRVGRPAAEVSLGAGNVHRRLPRWRI